MHKFIKFNHAITLKKFLKKKLKKKPKSFSLYFSQG